MDPDIKQLHIYQWYIEIKEMLMYLGIYKFPVATPVPAETIASKEHLSHFFKNSQDQTAD